MVNYLFIFIIGLFSLIYTSLANAYSCTASQSTISPPNITVNSGLSVGDKIGNNVTASLIQSYACANTTSMTKQVAGFTAVGEYAMSASDGTRIYKTNIQGIGYAVGGLIGNCGTIGWVGVGSYILGNVNSVQICDLTGTYTSIASIAYIQLYKIAQTTGSGTVVMGTTGYVSMAINNALYPTPQAGITVNNFEVINPGCTVTTPTINVVMNDVVKNLFNGVGTFVDSKKASFSIGLTCPANTPVLVRIDGNIMDASKGLLNITSGSSSASGVAIQILYNGLPLTLAAPVSVGTAVTQGTFTIPLQARYYQSGATVKPGNADGTATFTVTYQ